jgi:trimeric autotransporter adhesin
MARSERVRCGVGKLSKTGSIGIAGLALLLGSGLAWAGPPNPTASDSSANTAGGTNALIITTGLYNTGFGYQALFQNTAGTANTAFGINALYGNTTAAYNTAIGFDALLSNTTGAYNTASGAYALHANTEGIDNTASGLNALFSNTTGNYNTANGFHAVYNNTEGSDNTASGTNALFSNTTGAANTASGVDALYANTTGGDNTAIGLNAGLSNNTGSENTFVGVAADAHVGSYTNGTALGFGAVLTASNSIVLGNSSISRIYANVTTITAISDRRRKKDIKALAADLGLDFIKKLQPVSYRFNNGDETERYGFIAQDLEQALPGSLHDTVERSESGRGLALIERQNDNDRTYRVSYGELTAPIVKAIQEQQQEIEAERFQNTSLRRALAAVEDQVAALKVQNDALRQSIETLRKRIIASR